MKKTDPLDIFQEQVSASCALMVEQLQQWAAVAVEQLKNAQRIAAAAAAVPAVQVPKEKEEMWSIEEVEEEEEELPHIASRKRSLNVEEEQEEEEQEEHSGEISFGEDSDSFINDEPSEHEEEEEEEESNSAAAAAAAPPRHRQEISGNNNKRIRKVPQRYSPTKTIVQSKKEDAKAELKGIELGGRRATKGEDQEWNLVRKKTPIEQKRNRWFQTRWGDHLDLVIRAGLGRETINNMEPREIWDNMAKKPETFEIKSLSHPMRDYCVFCGDKRFCSSRLMFDNKISYMGSCCARLARAWKAFQTALPEEESLKKMDRLFEEVRAAHVAKGQRKNKE